MDSLHLAPEGGDAYPIPLQNLQNLQSLNQANLHQHNTTFNPQNPFQPVQQSHHHHHHHSHAQDDANSFVSFSHRRHHDEMPPPADRRPRKLVLCFDGTGNKFRGDDSDSNILKIFRMLDRTADDQYHYYQRMYHMMHSNYPWTLY